MAHKKSLRKGYAKLLQFKNNEKKEKKNNEKTRTAIIKTFRDPSACEFLMFNNPLTKLTKSAVK